MPDRQEARTAASVSLCSVCGSARTLNAYGRISAHFRPGVESPFVRDRYGVMGVPCEGAGRLPARAEGAA